VPLFCDLIDGANYHLKGANPGGGGIEFLSRLAGRSRALEVVLGADRIDADTAALYGCKLI
jgi:enoyl-CoA hydratase/carnithine racemase